MQSVAEAVEFLDDSRTTSLIATERFRGSKYRGSSARATGTSPDATLLREESAPRDTVEFGKDEKTTARAGRILPSGAAVVGSERVGRLTDGDVLISTDPARHAMFCAPDPRNHSLLSTTPSTTSQE